MAVAFLADPTRAELEAAWAALRGAKVERVCGTSLGELGRIVAGNPNYSAAEQRFAGAILALRADAEATRRLLGQWMFWASGVAFKSELGEELVAATDKVLAADFCLTCSGAGFIGKPCEPCGGSGAHGARGVGSCRFCGGSGRLLPGNVPERDGVPCPTCNSSEVRNGA